MGRAIAHRLAGDGFMVVVNYSSSPNAAEGVFQEIGQDGGNAIAIQANVSECVDVERLFTNMPPLRQDRLPGACLQCIRTWVLGVDMAFPALGTPPVARENPPQERFLDELRCSCGNDGKGPDYSQRR